MGSLGKGTRSTLDAFVGAQICGVAAPGAPLGDWPDIATTTTLLTKWQTDRSPSPNTVRQLALERRSQFR